MLPQRSESTGKQMGQALSHCRLAIMVFRGGDDNGEPQTLS